MGEVGASSLQNVLRVGERLASLLLDATLYEITRCRVNRNLTRCKYETINFNSLAIRSYSSRRIVCVNCVHNFYLLISYFFTFLLFYL